MPITRTATGKLPPTRQLEIGSTTGAQTVTTTTKSGTQVVIKQTSEEIKEKMEQQLKIQRAAHHQKRALDMKQQGKQNYVIII